MIWPLPRSSTTHQCRNLWIYKSCNVNKLCSCFQFAMEFWDESIVIHHFKKKWHYYGTNAVSILPNIYMAVIENELRKNEHTTPNENGVLEGTKIEAKYWSKNSIFYVKV